LTTLIQFSPITMTTRFNIARLDPDTGRVTSVYCHSRGYLAGVGAKLEVDYNSDAAAVALLAPGNLSWMERRVLSETGEAHSFGAPLDGGAVDYARNRGDAWDDEQPLEHASKIQWLAACLENTGDEHLHLFEDGRWSHFDAWEARGVVAALAPLRNLTNGMTSSAASL
jgi:hypothetical protein